MGLNLGTGFALGNSLNNLPPKTGNGTGGNANAFYNAIDTGMVSPPQFDPRRINTQNRNPVPQNIQFGNNPFQNGQQVGISDIMRTLGNQQTVQSRNPNSRQYTPYELAAGYQGSNFDTNAFLNTIDPQRAEQWRRQQISTQQPFFGTPSQAFMPETDWVRMANAGYDRAGRPIQQPLPQRPMQNQPQPQPQRPNIPWLMW